MPALYKRVKYHLFHRDVAAVVVVVVFVPSYLVTRKGTLFVLSRIVTNNKCQYCKYCQRRGKGI